jgi:hypothetical protein
MQLGRSSTQLVWSAPMCVCDVVWIDLRPVSLYPRRALGEDSRAYRYVSGVGDADTAVDSSIIFDPQPDACAQPF